MRKLNLVSFGLCVSSLALLANCGGEWSDDSASPGSGGAATGTGGVVTGVGGTGQVGVGGTGQVGVGGAGQVGVGGAGQGVGGTGQGVGGTGQGAGGTGQGVGGSGQGTGGAAGPVADENGKFDAKPGDTTNVPLDYLKLGQFRLLNNNWGSKALGCNTPMSVFINQDKSFGYTFDRGTCGGEGSKPDFPELEFGVHPFGMGSVDATSPDFSSTAAMPIQIKDIQSCKLHVENMSIAFQDGRQSKWNLTFELWVSERHPINDASPGVYSELMTFWGQEANRWPEPPNGEGPIEEQTVNQNPAVLQAGDKSYKLWVKRDQWGGPNQYWRYYQFRDANGSSQTFSGTLDIKTFLDYMVQQRGHSPDAWVTRLEIGSEIDDNTKGSVTMKGISYELNGQTYAPEFGQ